MTPQALIFDKDGTLIHHDETWVNYVPALFQELAGGHRDQWNEIGRAVGFDFGAQNFIAVSYTHLTLPTNREV